MGDYDADIPDASLSYVVQDVKEDRLVAHRQEVLGDCVSQGSKSCSLAGGQNESLH